MFEQESHLIFQALSMWANYIETSDVNKSKTDALNVKNKPNDLTESQIQLVDRLRNLANDALDKKIDLTERV